METRIIRHYPQFKSLIKIIEYPNRTNINDVNTIKELSKDKHYNDDYIKWISGINYESKTKNKIKIGGKIHTKLGEKFLLKHIANYTKSYTGEKIYYCYNNKDILFSDIDDIDWDNYLLETEQIYNEINNENEIINEKNKKVIEYNDKVAEVIEQINKLKKWEQCIEFEGINYGIPHIYDDTHRENDCFGLIKEDYYEGCTCHCCEDWGGCNNPTGTQYYKCEKCDYKYSKSINYSKNYKGK
jgi:hypothetical protein